MKTSYKVDLTVVGLIQKDLGRYLLRRERYLSFSERYSRDEIRILVSRICLHAVASTRSSISPKLFNILDQLFFSSPTATAGTYLQSFIDFHPVLTEL